MGRDVGLSHLWVLFVWTLPALGDAIVKLGAAGRFRGHARDERNLEYLALH